MRVEVLYFEGCPHYKPAVERVREVLRAEGISASIIETEVPDQVAAQRDGFLGSPTIKINGVDVEPEARTSQAYAVACRTYLLDGRQVGLPSKETIRAAIAEASRLENQPDCCAASVPANVAKSSGAKSSLVMVGSVFAAVLASLCCILPIVFGLTGLTVVGASAEFAAWRPYLLIATLGFLAAGFYFAYRPSKAACDPGSACAIPATKRSSRVVLWLTTTAVAAIALFPYYSGPVADFLLPRKTAHAASPVAVAVRHASLVIEGMDCSACAAAVESKLKNITGVERVRVSLEQKAAEVDYNPAIASPEQFRKAIEEAGYRVAKGA